jgi:hypothetical protein
MWARYTSASFNQELCPLCADPQRLKQLPVSQRRQQRLPCPEHGTPSLLPENHLAWWLYQTYLCNQVRVIGDTVELDMPSVKAVFDMLGIEDQDEQLDKVVVLFEFYKEQSEARKKRTIKPRSNRR